MTDVDNVVGEGQFEDPVQILVWGSQDILEEKLDLTQCGFLFVHLCVCYFVCVCGCVRVWTFRLPFLQYCITRQVLGGSVQTPKNWTRFSCFISFICF